MTTPDPNVTRWAPIAQEAAAQTGVPASLLLADIAQESGGNPAAVSSAGAGGLTQFIPSTARRWGVTFGTGPAAVRSQIFGQARFLASMGAATNPARALEGYFTGTPGSSAGSSYAASVLAQQPAYAAFDHGVKLPAGSSAGASSAAPSTSSSGSVVSGDQAHGALYALIWMGLLLTAGVLLLLGLNQTTKGAPARAARRVAMAGAAA